MSPKTVLVVDDHHDTRVICRELLVHYGYTVLEAADAAQAVSTAFEHGPDLILLDYYMPPTSGLETLALLRANDGLRHTVIALFTAGAMQAAEMHAIEGVQRVIFKPIEPKKLLAVVRELIGEA